MGFFEQRYECNAVVMVFEHSENSKQNITRSNPDEITYIDNGQRRVEIQFVDFDPNLNNDTPIVRSQQRCFSYAPFAKGGRRL